MGPVGIPIRQLLLPPNLLRALHVITLAEAVLVEARIHDATRRQLRGDTSRKIMLEL